MPKSGPIVIIEDDRDDQELLQEVFQELKVPNIIRFFDSCLEALDYLKVTIEKPFLILSDINLPAMSGFELKKQINQNEYLRKKGIPFIFLTTSSELNSIARGYEMFPQGFFIKPTRLQDIKEMMARIIYYWKFAAVPV